MALSALLLIVPLRTMYESQIPFEVLAVNSILSEFVQVLLDYSVISFTNSFFSFFKNKNYCSTCIMIGNSY